MKTILAIVLAWSFSASPMAGSKIMADEPQDCEKADGCADKIDSIEIPATRGDGWSDARKRVAKPMERKLPPPPQDDPGSEQPK
jgi:hypothetical protein